MVNIVILEMETGSAGNSFISSSDGSWNVGAERLTVILC